MIRAVIDLGTNTFHLLIAETDVKSYIRPIWQDRCYVYLAADGIGQISDAALERAISTILRFQKKIDAFHPDEVIVSGTEAFRKAKNGHDLSQHISNILNTKVYILSGEEEAMLIGKGVALAIHPLRHNGIAVDIGGGSTELVSIQDGKSTTFISQPCGIAYLYNRFHLDDPISTSSLEYMKSYISSCYENFIITHRSEAGAGGLMIGVAGTFEVLSEMNSTVKHTSLTSQLVSIDHSFMGPLIEKVSKLDLSGRENIPGLPEERAMYFLEGLIIMEQIWRMHPFEAFCISSYSIKHGLMISNF